MKFFAVLLVVGFVALAQASPLTEEDKCKYKEYKKECIAETKVAEDVVHKAKHEGIFPADNAELKDFYVCLFKKLKVLKDDSSVDLENSKATLVKKYDEATATKIVEECGKIKYDDVKETSFHLAQCFFKYAPKKTEKVEKADKKE